MRVHFWTVGGMFLRRSRQSAPAPIEAALDSAGVPLSHRVSEVRARRRLGAKATLAALAWAATPVESLTRDPDGHPAWVLRLRGGSRFGFDVVGDDSQLRWLSVLVAGSRSVLLSGVVDGEGHALVLSFVGPDGSEDVLVRNYEVLPPQRP